MKKKYIIFFSVALVLLAFTAYGLYIGYYKGYIRMNYPTFADYPVQGIDVSHHQEKIDWGKLDKQAVQFAFIKATEGGNHKDSMFQENWREARDHQILSGAYHFFTFCKEGEEQARNYIHYVPRDSIDLPPIIDLEYGGNCQEANRKEDLILEITRYLEIIEDHYQRKVIIYTTNEFYRNHLQNRFPDNPIWIRNILSEPNLPDGRKWTFWQFANRGRLDGITTLVDLNAFNGSREEFDKMLLKH
ncbi:lysozyme [Dysgonomonas sp. PFB1-18]|uniref:glycoside hydrolase family 25 protein n=1 Tax=unclassified Dysgonomonas TaxID=2630389 RepID=UPI0024770D57|nr:MULTISPECIES: GH25 family lysozyme [unclassified Dysgonomonas]MDH6308630.1 lysozyme [Dysgonomonas sp. PF1-14]MDH6338131.1 lysozyme [Dysgonomonas sp. PF1-16]MDH6379628.1 lysozyme [Dysgonomonas sp. PFB1-18]MDH6396958.1 lysozyme [Dysgonomonas sp. PF1-23]